MKLFKSAKGEVFAYEADGSQDAFIKAGLVPITQAEADALRAPAPPGVPAEIRMDAARIVLLRHGYTDAAIKTAIAAVLTPAQQAEALITWEFRTEVRRDSNLTKVLALALTLTDAQVDAMFIEALALT